MFGFPAADFLPAESSSPPPRLIPPRSSECKTTTDQLKSFVAARDWIATEVRDTPLTRDGVEARLALSTWVTSAAEAVHPGVAEIVAAFERHFGA